MPKRVNSPEIKISAAKEYLSGKGSYRAIAEKYKVNKTTVQEWTALYQAQGEAGFYKQPGNAKYTKEFKAMCVKAVLTGEGTVDEIKAKWNIASRRTLRQWIMCYNANMELKDYDPKREVYMAEARRKTTQEERKEIVEYCIGHGNDYKGTAALYEVSYSQVYSWVKKYREWGESGLEDRRGRQKSDEELSELERLERENKRLKRQLEERDMLVELLKKVKEIEGR